MFSCFCLGVWGLFCRPVSKPQLRLKLVKTCILFLLWDLPDHLQSPKTPKSLKKSPRGAGDAPTLDPQKFKKKSEKKSMMLTIFSACRTILELLGGPGSGCPQLLSGDFLRLFGILGFCRWSGRSHFLHMHRCHHVFHAVSSDKMIRNTTKQCFFVAILLVTLGALSGTHTQSSEKRRPHSWGDKGVKNLAFQLAKLLGKKKQSLIWQAPDAPSKRITAKCTIKTYFLVLLLTSLMRSKEYVLMVHFAMIRFDGASGACQLMLIAEVPAPPRQFQPPNWKLAPSKKDWRPPICSFRMELHRSLPYAPSFIWKLICRGGVS